MDTRSMAGNRALGNMHEVGRSSGSICTCSCRDDCLCHSCIFPTCSITCPSSACLMSGLIIAFCSVQVSFALITKPWGRNPRSSAIHRGEAACSAGFLPHLRNSLLFHHRVATLFPRRYHRSLGGSSFGNAFLFSSRSHYWRLLASWVCLFRSRETERLLREPDPVLGWLRTPDVNAAKITARAIESRLGIYFLGRRATLRHYHLLCVLPVWSTTSPLMLTLGGGKTTTAGQRWREWLRATVRTNLRGCDLRGLSLSTRCCPACSRKLNCGVEMDLSIPVRDLEELRVYCYRVASAVGSSHRDFWISAIQLVKSMRSS